MDKQQFKDFIKSVAEIKDEKPTRTASSGRLPTEWVTETDPATGEEYQVERIIPLTNDTLGFTLVKIKPQSKLCELGCGDIVEDQVIERRFGETPKPHWKTRCKNCGCYVTPDGQGFVDNSHGIQQLYFQHFAQGVVRKIVQIKQMDTQTSEIKEYHKEPNPKWTTDEQGVVRYQE
jgi:hypothetical protein